MSKVENLAREIGASFHPIHECERFRCEWVRQLAAVVGEHAWPVLHSYPDKVIVLAREIGAARDDQIRDVMERAHEQIHAVDYDDGWATDKAGAALESVCLALCPNTRWLAHAGQHVWRFATGCGSYNAVVKLSMDAWLRHLYAKTAFIGCGDMSAEVS